MAGAGVEKDLCRREVVVFDWDGTVADSVAQVVQAIRKTAESLGLTPPPAETIRPLVGLGLGEMLQQFVPDFPAERHAEFLDTYRRHYFGNRQRVDIPFAGIPELLKALRAQGRRLAVATGKSRAWTGCWPAASWGRSSRQRAAPKRASRSLTRGCCRALLKRWRSAPRRW